MRLGRCRLMNFEVISIQYCLIFVVKYLEDGTVIPKCNANYEE